MRWWPREFRSPGLSLIPVLLGCSVVVPVVLAVLGAGQTAQEEREASAVRSDPDAALSVACEKLGQLFRPAILSSFRVRATELDAATATEPVALGAWVAPAEHDPRPGVQFRVASGVPTGKAPGTATVREIEFVMDAGERSNGGDDDGDGLVDEGVLILRTGDTETQLLANVEMFSVAFEGRSLRITLGCALSDDSGEFRRAVMVRDFVVRNS